MLGELQCHTFPIRGLADVYVIVRLFAGGYGFRLYVLPWILGEAMSGTQVTRLIFCTPPAVTIAYYFTSALWRAVRSLVSWP